LKRIVIEYQYFYEWGIYFRDLQSGDYHLLLVNEPNY
jgi:hypothetical protein